MKYFYKLMNSRGFAGRLARAWRKVLAITAEQQSLSHTKGRADREIHFPKVPVKPKRKTTECILITAELRLPLRIEVQG